MPMNTNHTSDASPHETALIEAARGFVSTLRDRSDEIEAARRVPPELAREMARAGLFRMLAPTSLGGGAVHPRTIVEVLETLATGDSAASWCVMTGATTGLCTAYLEPDAAAEIWGDGDTILAGVFAPMGRATPTESGFTLTGQWPFGSGCENADWRMGGALVDGRVQCFFFPSEQSLVVDTWTVTGLCGTGSHDIRVTDIEVPASHLADLFNGLPKHEGALFAFPVFGLLALGVCAAGLGIARAALDDFVAQASKKRPGRRSRAEDSLVQVAVAGAEGDLRAARSLVYSTVEAVWRTAQSGVITETDRSALRLAATHATRLAVRAVDAVYEAGGGGAIYAGNRLQRHFRDIHTVTQHIMVGRGTLKPIGRILLGLDTDTAQL